MTFKSVMFLLIILPNTVFGSFRSDSLKHEIELNIFGKYNSAWGLNHVIKYDVNRLLLISFSYGLGTSSSPYEYPYWSLFSGNMGAGVFMNLNKFTFSIDAGATVSFSKTGLPSNIIERVLYFDEQNYPLGAFPYNAKWEWFSQMTLSCRRSINRFFIGININLIRSYFYNYAGLDKRIGILPGFSVGIKMK
jgi:hypothetical protein